MVSYYLKALDSQLLNIHNDFNKKKVKSHAIYHVAGVKFIFLKFVKEWGDWADVFTIYKKQNQNQIHNWYEVILVATVRISNIPGITFPLNLIHPSAHNCPSK